MKRGCDYEKKYYGECRTDQRGRDFFCSTTVLYHTSDKSFFLALLHRQELLLLLLLLFVNVFLCLCHQGPITEHRLRRLRCLLKGHDWPCALARWGYYVRVIIVSEWVSVSDLLVQYYRRVSRFPCKPGRSYNFYIILRVPVVAIKDLPYLLP